MFYFCNKIMQIQLDIFGPFYIQSMTLPGKSAMPPPVHLLLETKNMTLTFWYLSHSKHLSAVLHRKVQETFSLSASKNVPFQLIWQKELTGIKKKNKSLAAPRRHLILFLKTLWLLTLKNSMASYLKKLYGFLQVVRNVSFPSLLWIIPTGQTLLF